MIQPNELRIGNWVFDDCNDPCQISSLNSRKKAKFEGWDNDFGGDGPLVEYAGKDGIYISESINPIPLTAEWLERCGFEKQINESQIDGIEMTFHVDEGTYFASCGGFNGSLGVLCLCRGNYFANNLRYVHQLQNLYFALTGQELNFNEPKHKN